MNEAHTLEGFEKGPPETLTSGELVNKRQVAYLHYDEGTWERMDDKTILEQLEALSVRVGITVRYEPLKIDGAIHTGGYCRIRGQDYVIINKKVAIKDKIHVLADALKRYDLRHLYMLPSLRKVLEVDDGGEDD